MPSRSEFSDVVGCLVRAAHGDVIAVLEEGRPSTGQDGGHMFICRPGALHQDYCPMWCEDSRKRVYEYIPEEACARILQVSGWIHRSSAAPEVFEEGFSGCFEARPRRHSIRLPGGVLGQTCHDRAELPQSGFCERPPSSRLCAPGRRPTRSLRHLAVTAAADRAPPP
jgi:hypothetical protein